MVAESKALSCEPDDRRDSSQHKPCSRWRRLSNENQRSVKSTASSSCICSNCQTKPTISILLEDDIATVGKWYMGDCIAANQPSSRTTSHQHWALALWDLAQRDAALSGCLALLTLHKKRALSGRFDMIGYLNHKQDVYRLLQDQIAARRTCTASTTALVICLVSFIEVMEGRLEEAKTHIQAVNASVATNDVDELSWRLLAWNDHRYAMKMAANPTLPFNIPKSLNADSHTSKDLGVHSSEARRLALGNWKQTQHIFAGTDVPWYEILEAVHLLGIMDAYIDIPFRARIAKLYKLEYELHATAAEVVRSGTTVAKLLVTTMQLHVLILSSMHAPSTPECRQILLQRGCSLVKQLQREAAVSGLGKHQIAFRWCLFMLGAYMIDEDQTLDRDEIMRTITICFGPPRFRSRSDFLRTLLVWPWLDRWHYRRACRIWSMVLVARGGRWQLDTSGHDLDQSNGSSRPYYSGVLMFYDT